MFVLKVLKLLKSLILDRFLTGKLCHFHPGFKPSNAKLRKLEIKHVWRSTLGTTTKSTFEWSGTTTMPTIMSENQQKTFVLSVVDVQRGKIKL